MRRYILLLCALCLGLVSCVKEDMPVNIDGDVTFKAAYADASTRTVLDGLTPMWTPEDTISIYEGANNKFYNSLTAPAALAEYKGNLEGQGIQKGQFIAASPYDSSYTFSFVGMYVGGMIVPSEQTAVAGSYDPKAAPAVAFAESTSLSFHNAYSLVRFSLMDDGVTKVHFEGNAQEKIAGKMNVAKDAPLRTTITKGENSVVLSGSFEKGKTYYLSVIPANLPTGFKIHLETADGSKVLSMEYNNAVALERSGIVDVGILSLDHSNSTLPDSPDDSDEPKEGTIYFMPSSNWLADDARFAAYFWEDGKEEVWVDLSADSSSGVYKCELPEGYTNVIFTRMNPAASENNWDNKWNQTADLKVPTGDNICYVLPDGSWGEDGYWTTYPPTVTEPDPTPDPTPDPGTGGGSDTEQVRIYLSSAWGWPYIWCWDSDGAQIFAGASWPGTRYHGEENGYYYWDVPQAYVGKTVSMLAVKEDQSEQTSDYIGIVLDKSVYFYLEWTSELGCHLIQENK